MSKSLKEYRELQEPELKTKINDFRRESLNLRFQKSSGQLENTARISFVRKEIARLKTLINQKKTYQTREIIMPKRILQGTVISNKANKTISVLVERKIMHPVYKKYIKRTKKYAVHDEKNESKIGEIVKIQENRPISKTKKWILIN